MVECLHFDEIGQSSERKQSRCRRMVDSLFLVHFTY